MHHAMVVLVLMLVLLQLKVNQQVRQGSPPRPGMQQNATPPNRLGATPKIPPEDHVPEGCSLLSMEPLCKWFCKGADMISPAEYEATLCQLEHDPLDIRQYNDNIREEWWTHFSLEGVKFPTATVDVIQRGEALAIFERDLIIHFQHISKAAAVHVRAPSWWNKESSQVHRRVDDTTKNYPWSHAKGILMVALTNMNLPHEAWRSARLLRAVPNCRLVLMLACSLLSPALSIEEAALMTYLQTPQMQPRL